MMWLGSASDAPPKVKQRGAAGVTENTVGNTCYSTQEPACVYAFTTWSFNCPNPQSQDAKEANVKSCHVQIEKWHCRHDFSWQTRNTARHMWVHYPSRSVSAQAPSRLRRRCFTQARTHTHTSTFQFPLRSCQLSLTAITLCRSHHSTARFGNLPVSSALVAIGWNYLNKTQQNSVAFKGTPGMTDVLFVLTWQQIRRAPRGAQRTHKKICKTSRAQLPSVGTSFVFSWGCFTVVVSVS